MQKLIIKFGLIAGIIVSIALYLGTTLAAGSDMSNDLGQIIGYASMLAAFSTIFIAIKKRKDEADGMISFKHAFSIGLGITLIASLLYVITWMLLSSGVEAEAMMSDYFQEAIADVKASGESVEEIQKNLDKINRMRENYKNPFIKFMFTLVEIFPIGLIVSIISALILRKKV